MVTKFWKIFFSLASILSQFRLSIKKGVDEEYTGST